MNYQNAYNEITLQAIRASEAGDQIPASAPLSEESRELLQELFDRNCRWIDGTARLIAAGMIPEEEGKDRERILFLIDDYLRARAEATGWPLNLTAAAGLGELDPEDPLAAGLPSAVRWIDFGAIEAPVYGKAQTEDRRIVGKLVNNRRLADVPLVLCRCSCGNYFIAREEAVLRGHVRYCGPNCRKRPGQTKAQKPAAPQLKRTAEQIAEEKRLRSVWGNMIRRCTSETDADWDAYGGRGIRVCREWTESFEAFRDWAIRSGYHKGLTLDRIDNNGDYTPQNCQWSTMKEQSNNRRTCILVTYGGQRMTLKQAAEASGLSYSALRYRYHAHGEAGLFGPLQHTAARSGR